MKRFYKAWIIMVMKNERGLKILFYFSLCFVGTPERPLADNEKEKSELFCFFMHISLHSHPNIWIATLCFSFKDKNWIECNWFKLSTCLCSWQPKKKREREALVTCWLTAKSGKMVRKGEQPVHKQVQNQRRGKERGGKNRTGTGKGKGVQTWN